ncbi:MAG: glycosyltransferase family 2 protein [Bdellovibrio sp.]|nr:glycosyltransferase family 2 protein [Bdellovibrio sp.]
MQTISVVIPAYNEEGRLPKTLAALQKYSQRSEATWSVTEVFVVDDGSKDQTSSVVKKAQATWANLRLLELNTNQGKGAAVHEGIRQASGEWVLIADADMATPWEELEKLWAVRDECNLAMGSRALPKSDIVVRQHWLRQSMGKSFNKILRSIVGLPFRDTQCGFKLIKNSPFFRTEILPYLQVARFAWDVELILLLLRKNQRVIEVPIRWQHQEASRVHIVRDSFEMLWTVLKLKVRLSTLPKGGGFGA